jgi:hypothetical protein
MKPKYSFDMFKHKDIQTQYAMLYRGEPIDLGFMMHKLEQWKPDLAKTIAQMCLKQPHHREHMLALQESYNELYPLLPDLIKKHAFVFARVLSADVDLVCRPLDLETLAKTP